MYRDLIEDKLYQVVDQFSKRKINQRDFILYYLTIIICFIIGTGELARYFLLTRF